MVLKIKLRNYRNYEEFEITFRPGLNLIVGENGVGKTNLLEAVFLLVEGRSMRTTDIRETIRNDSEENVVEGIFEGVTDGKARIWLRKDEGGIKETAKEVNAVAFTPDDLYLVKGSPEWRRRYLDELLRSVKPTYNEILKDYNRVLRQRNEAIRMVRKGLWGRENVRFWNEIFVKRGLEIVMERKRMLKKVEDELNANKDTWGMGEIKVKYFSSLSLEAEEENHRRLKRIEDVEIRRGSTMVGPHRDEIVFYIDGKNVRREGSQGEQKILSIMWRLTQAGILKEVEKKEVIVLLDDCFSELDEKNRRRLGHSLKSWKQVLVTATEEVKEVQPDNVIHLGA